MLSYFDPNCEYQPVEELDAVCGHQALIEWTERWLEAWSAYSDRIEEIIDGGDGDKVLVHQHAWARGAGSGIELELDTWVVWTVDKDGLMTRLEAFLPDQKTEAFRAAGLSE